MRVIPRWKAIKDLPGVLPCEDVREILKASAPITAMNCPCKKLKGTGSAGMKSQLRHASPLEGMLNTTLIGELLGGISVMMKRWNSLSRWIITDWFIRRETGIPCLRCCAIAIIVVVALS
jgi:hypothetical protein